MLFSLRGPNVIWGGSWAIRRELFEELKIREAWQGTLSDDFVATRVVYAAGRRVMFEPACMVASPLDLDLPAMLSFVRRQYLIGRVYVPLAWTLGFVLIAYANLVFLGGLALTAWGLATGAPWAWMPACLWPPSSVEPASAADPPRLALAYFPEASEAIRKAGRFDRWAGPLITLVNGAELLASFLGREITWRGITYRLFRGGRIALLRRKDPPAEAQRPEETYPLLDTTLMAERKAA